MSRRMRLALAAVLALLLVADQLFPPPLPGRAAPHAQVVLARDGTPLRAFPDRTHIWRHPVRADEVSPRYVEALIAYEDRFFRWHPGVNPLALLRAAGQWAMSGRVVSGGSTLTMQVARILDPTPRTLRGKLRQMVRALQLELRLSKREILELYLGYAPMGGVLEGVEAASRAYLGKPAARLTEAEAALLTVLPQAPSLLRPDRYPERARAARDKVLARMTTYWGAERVRDAREEPVIAQTVREPLLAPLFAERVRREHPRRPRLETTLDAGMQGMVEQLLASRLSVLPPRVSMAALVVDNATLEVLAYAGSADFGDESRFAHVDMVRAARSPGSTLKPFLYGLALDEGLIHSESLLADVPQSFSGYQPGNFQANFSGPVSVSHALQKSLNVPAVEVLDRLGPQRFVAQLRRGGLRLELPRGAAPNLSVILGGAATSLENLVGAYSSFARGGIAARPRYTREAPLEEARMMSAGAAFIVRDILESGGPLARAVEGGVGVRRGIAFKTGTSFGFRDAWSVGVSDRLTVGVWVGRPDGTPNPGFFGANIAAPLLIDVFAAVDGAQPGPRFPPEGVSQAKICWPLGTRGDELPPGLCHEQRTAWILNDAAPPTFPDRLRGGAARYTDHRDADSGLRVRAACAPGEMRAVEMARWPAALEPWLDAATRRHALPPAWAPTCKDAVAPEAGLKIVGVTDGGTIRRAGTGPAPELRLEARGGQDALTWLVNGVQVGRAAAGRALLWKFPVAGPYRITAMDDAGRFDSVEISVR
ncbi:penicillin-binding protein 1C [Aromatoleum evansii]|uniref:peptidoglycan glycosyltransferase n=1 Tax=Aromatoleum evansii TaxID=59406 RepID=A0ABZ1AKZ6_AROEV|nr:penicillin-binding protein 1C [Aromatoleum evansii]